MCSSNTLDGDISAKSEAKAKECRICSHYLVALLVYLVV
jgi:hypothetical protein